MENGSKVQACLIRWIMILTQEGITSTISKFKRLLFLKLARNTNKIANKRLHLFHNYGSEARGKQFDSLIKGD